MSDFNNISSLACVENIDVAPTTRIFDAYVRNARIGENSIIRDGSRIENCEFGIHVDLQRYAMIYHTTIDDYTYTGRNFVSWYAQIGKFCSISWNVSIGGANHDYSKITQHAFLYAHQFGFLDKEQPSLYNRFEDECVIGNDVWIGCNAVICRKVHVGNGAVIAAGAVVTDDVEPYTIVGGVPAKILKRRCPKDWAGRLEKTAWWDLPAHIIKENIELFNAEISEESVRKIEILCK